eukprot:jgi/Mesvir1/17156/Mv07581-RA.1
MVPNPPQCENGFNTVIWPADADGIALAAKWLQEGQAVGFPTETVYGLGADASRDEAVKRIFSAKGRPADNPLICHVASAEAARNIVTGFDGSDGIVQHLASTFWPGPLTLVLPVRQHEDPSRILVSRLVTAGLDTVGVRVPSHPVALALLQACGPNIAVAAPSANLSGRPSPTCAEHVLRDLQGRIPGVLDGGDCHVGVESTVLDCTCRPFVILRPGGVTLAQLRGVLGAQNVVMGSGSVEKISPADAVAGTNTNPHASVSGTGRHPSAIAGSNDRANSVAGTHDATVTSRHAAASDAVLGSARDGQGANGVVAKAAENGIAANGIVASGIAANSAESGSSHDANRDGSLRTGAEDGLGSSRGDAEGGASHEGHGKKPSGPKAPGMKYVHYAPRRAAIHFVSSMDQARLNELVAEAKARGQRVGVMRPRTGGEAGSDEAVADADGGGPSQARAGPINGAVTCGSVSEGAVLDGRRGGGEHTAGTDLAEGETQVNGFNGGNGGYGARALNGVSETGGHADTGGACADVVRYCGSAVDLESAARELYRCLRSFDEDEDVGRGVDVVFAYGFSADTVGEAVLNRLLHASRKTVE